jgi:Histidine kinase-, DNA gyrase B-, and HSP90-like ATPase/His Kinase A (phospho-acceptor) domain
MAVRTPIPSPVPVQHTGTMAGSGGWEGPAATRLQRLGARVAAVVAVLSGTFALVAAAVHWAARGSAAGWIAAGTALVAAGAFVVLARRHGATAAPTSPAAATAPAATGPTPLPVWALRTMRLVPGCAMLVEVSPGRAGVRCAVRAAREVAEAPRAVAAAPLGPWLADWHRAHADAGAPPPAPDLQRWLDAAFSAADPSPEEAPLHGWRALRLDAAPDGAGAWLVVWRPPAVTPPPAQDPVDNERESIAYSVSHDLRAPIRVIEGFTRIVREDYDGVLDRVGRDHLDRVLGAAARMNHMIDALIALSRLSTQPLARERVDLSDLATQILDDLRRQAPERAVQWLVAPGLVVQGDAVLLHCVLENLLGNAWKYSARRATAVIEMGVATPAEVQTLGAGGPVARPERPVFFVSDNGAGFDMRFAHRLFGAFQRLHSASDFAGTGVGLASVRRILRRHGGDIWAQGAVDKGSRFYFTLG